MKKLLLAIFPLLLLVGCWHPNYGDYANPVKWPCGPVTVSADGDPWFNSLVAYTVSEINSLSYPNRVVYIGSGGAVQVHHSWPASAPWGWGWTGVPPQGGYLLGGQVLINPAVPDYKLLAVIRHEMAHAMGLGHDDDNEPTLMSSSGTGAYNDYTPMDALGLKTMLTCG